MFTKQKRHEVDMCNGPLFPKIITFFIPVMLSNMLQLVYNAADQLIVGRFAGSRALASVGATASLVNLIVCFLTGLSVGASSVIARHFGANNQRSLTRAAHTSVMISLIGGLLFGMIGIVFSKPLLRVMDTPEEVIRLSTLYMQIYFAGLPATALFNFASAILRAVGDTKRPMIFLIISGALNVVLNLVFVIIFKMGVAGVATATVISQILAAFLTVRCLINTEESYKIVLKNLKIYKAELLQIIQIGIPASIQSSAFSLSNVFIQSAINSFGEFAMAGCTAASNIDNMIYQAMNSLYHTTLSFTGQNYGAGKKDRIIKSVLYCGGVVTVLGMVIGGIAYIFCEPLLKMFVTNPEAIAFGMERLKIMCLTYFMCGMMEVGAGALRGINKSAISMCGSLIGACGLRIVWIYTVFAMSPSIFVLYISYPVTWLVTGIFLNCMFFYFVNKNKSENKISA